MKELLTLLFGLKFKTLFFDKTENGFIKFFRYCFVGGIAFIADYSAFSLSCLALGQGNTITSLATVIGFITGLIVNFVISKKLVFTENSSRVSVKGEFICYAVIGVIGAFLSVILMLLLTDKLFSINRYVAKLIAAMIVLVYNYFARKFIIYSN